MADLSDIIFATTLNDEIRNKKIKYTLKYDQMLSIKLKKK